jgi:hypothetical protein
MTSRGRCDVDASLRDVNRIDDADLDVAVNPRPFVIPRGGLTAIVDADGNDVGLVRAESQVAGKIVLERHPTVGTMTEMEAIDVDVAVGHHAVELDENILGGIGGLEREMLAVPANPGREEPIAKAAGVVLIDRALNAPFPRPCHPLWAQAWIRWKSS